MTYQKMSVDKVFAERPGINLADLAEEAVKDHGRTNGCTFEEDAARRAVEMLGFPAWLAAADVTQEERDRLAAHLEAMEIHCKHRNEPE